jgi:hypothetical protein
MKTKIFIIILAAVLAFLWHINAMAEFHYTMLKSTGNACPAILAHLNNLLNGPFSEELNGVKLMRETNADWVRLPSGFSRQPIEGDFDNDGTIDQVFQYDDGGRYICGTILYVVLGSEKKHFSSTENLSVSDVKIFPCQFDKRVLKSSSCPTISQEGDEAGINVSIGKKEVFFHGRYTDITLVRYKEKTYLVLRGVSGDTKIYGAVIEPRGGTKYSSTCLFKKSYKRK